MDRTSAAVLIVLAVIFLLLGIFVLFRLWKILSTTSQAARAKKARASESADGSDSDSALSHGSDTDNRDTPLSRRRKRARDKPRVHDEDVTPKAAKPDETHDPQYVQELESRLAGLEASVTRLQTRQPSPQRFPQSAVSVYSTPVRGQQFPLATSPPPTVMSATDLGDPVKQAQWQQMVLQEMLASGNYSPVEVLSTSS